MDNPWEIISKKLTTWYELAIASLPNVLLAILVLLSVYFVAMYLRRFAKKLLQKTVESHAIVNLASNALFIVLVTLGFAVALSILDLSKAVTSILAGAGIIGLAVGFAFQDIIANFISGILLAIRKPFEVGDVIESQDEFGTVEEINLRTTIIRSPQGELVYIPNKIIYQDKFSNYSTLGMRRIDLECGVGYESDLDLVKKETLSVIGNLGCLADDKDIQFYYKEFGGSSINYVVRFWVTYGCQTDYLGPQSDAIIAIKKKYDELGINIPFPIRTIITQNND